MSSDTISQHRAMKIHGQNVVSTLASEPHLSLKAQGPSKHANTQKAVRSILCCGEETVDY